MVHVGCVDLPHGIGWDRYFGRLSFLETSALTRGPLRTSVMNKWRAAAPGPGSFGLVAPPIQEQPLGLPRGVEALGEAVRGLDASAVVFRTPPMFSPSSGNRDLLRRFFAEVAPAEKLSGATRVWQPDGLWELPTALKLSKELGVVLGADPFAKDPTQDPPDLYATLGVPEVYFRVTGLGHGGRKLSSSQMEELAATVEVYERVWVVFATVDSFTDAGRFQGLVGTSVEELEALEKIDDEDDDGEDDDD